MIFIETPIFTKLLKESLPDESYRQLQRILLLRPESGTIIPGSSGLRKIRWNLSARGKRGGLRVIYYWDVLENTIYMLLLYKKSKQEDLSQEQLKILRKLVKEWLR